MSIFIVISINAIDIGITSNCKCVKILVRRSRSEYGPSHVTYNWTITFNWTAPGYLSNTQWLDDVF